MVGFKNRFTNMFFGRSSSSSSAASEGTPANNGVRNGAHGSTTHGIRSEDLGSTDEREYVNVAIPVSNGKHEEGEEEEKIITFPNDQGTDSKSQLGNVSVDRQRDILTKFIAENPAPEKKKNIPMDLVPSAPQQQTVASVTRETTISKVKAEIDVEMKVEAVLPKVPGKDIDSSLPKVKAEVDVEMKVEAVVPKISGKKGDDEPPPPAPTPASPTPTPIAVAPRLNERQVQNRAGGYSFKVCDMNRLRRYLVLGTEHNTYYSTPGQPSFLSKQDQNRVDNIQCVQNLLSQRRHEEIMKTITEYSLSGRIAKEDPILSILAMCANHEDKEVKQAAFNRVVEICNIPTKLFRFVDLTQDYINEQRKKNPPTPQKFKSDKKRKRELEKNLETLIISDGKPKEPSTNTMTSEPEKKKKKKVEPELKKVNRDEKKSSGWGRMRRKSVGRFYSDENKNAPRLLYLLTKYKHRSNWSHNEVISYSHPRIVGENEDAKNLVLRYCTHGYKKVEKECTVTNGVSEDMSEIINYINMLEKVNKLSPDKDGDEEELLKILKTYGKRDVPKEYASVNTYIPNDVPVENTEGKKCAIHIVREHLPTGFLNSKKVWEALLVDMPMTALVRNLGKMTSMGLFDIEDNLKTAVRSLTNIHKLKTARVHPMKLLIAMKVYEQGKGVQGELTWNVKKEIVKALDEAFYLSFRHKDVKDNYKTGKNYMLCLDVSGSMTWRGCVGCDLITPAMASAAMAWVTWNVEDHVEVVAFGRQLEDMKEHGFKKDMLITEVLKEARKMNFGATDCSLPMIHALQKKLPIDVFIVYTDSDTWAGRVQPVTALKNYNREMGRDAKLIVCGMESNGFTIADPQDPNMLDIIGFDANVAELISEFSKGNLSGACSDNCADCTIKVESR